MSAPHAAATLDLVAMGWARRRTRCPELPLPALPPSHSPRRGPAGEEPSSPSSSRQAVGQSNSRSAAGIADARVGQADDAAGAPSYHRGAPSFTLPPPGEPAQDNQAPPGGGTFSNSAALLPGLGPGGGVEAVLACRLEQIQRWGHTPENDRAQPIAPFLNRMLHEVHSYAVAAADDHRARTGLPQVRQRLVRLAALCLAAIDRIDAEAAEQEDQP